MGGGSRWGTFDGEWQEERRLRKEVGGGVRIGGEERGKHKEP